MTTRVTIGVPVYRGERFLEETLRSIQNQTYEDFQVLMSIDGPDPTCEAICKQFLGDGRFKMVVQPERLGWVGNLNWLLSQVETEFWYYHQQDDLTHESYLDVLIESIDRLPSAALVYCDIVPLGRITEAFEPEPPVLGGSAFIRQMTMLHQHLVAFPMRGLTRREALRKAGPVPTNAVADYGVDITWLTGIARWGELHRVPRGLYLKRYHDRNTESGWWAWSREKRLEAWPHHCVDMLNQALHLAGSIPEMRLLWLAAVERLTSSSTARTFVDLSELSTEQYRALLASFLTLAKTAQVHDIPHLLDADWSSIRVWTEAVYWMPGESPVDIVAYGPRPIEAGRPFNLQPDGSSAIWLRTSRAVRPGTRIRLGDEDLETVICGTVATAIVPKAATANPGEVPLVLADRNAQPLSNVVILQVIAAQADPGEATKA
jgi:glycosyltransferase involved in cell wall biosynthesis